MSISLKPHNIETYQKVTEKMKESNKVAVIHPTGTGKMFIALKFLEENKGKKAIYLAPTNAILHDVKKNIFAEGMTMVDFPLLKRMTYQKLTKFSDEEIDKLDADIIILDEFHHCGAPEWGKGVERLIQKNEGAQILGLSATPLRYFDGLRDMADELFENNVASEMTLEEAIESGILPEATYVSALYGYNKELENMQEQINKIKNVDKLQKAQSLLNGLREKLDANTDNLSDLFSTYMQNSNGKYIIFCRNIEDMDEKIKQSREMFEKVNPNITVRAVSSKIKEADSVFTEFEQDADESTLKLLYAVNMINEGYHIKDLDGVIMMRPTFSPTIYTQQLGRALTVGEDKKPVVLDLVNNFDSCKIIEDFAEKMKQYKGNEGTGKIEENKKSRISILDKTKEFREIAEKITELSSTKDVSLEEKIQIFEKFAQTGEELVGNTIFEGYPIGQWAIQIRNVLNRINNGKEEKQKINLTKKQIEKLKNLGILERQIESTIDEKIDSLVEWRRKYPKATITPMVSNEILSVYAKTEEEQKKLMEEYRKIIKYYGYVRFRKSQGKLNEEQIEKCREGNVGGVFGKSTETINKIEDETNMIMQKYGLNEETISLIKKQYGSIDEFRKIYIGALINQDIENSIPKKILENANLINAFDLSSPDWVLRSSGAVELVLDMLEEKIIFMKYKGIEKDIIDTIRTDNFTEPEQQVLTMIYGLNGEKRVNQSQAAINIGKSKERARQIHWHAIRKLNSSKLKIYLKNRISNIDYDLQKQIIEEYFNNFDIFVPRETTSMDEEVKNKLNNMLIDGIEKTKKRNEQVDIIKRMSEEQKMDILKARFGETISSSDISVVPPSSYKYIFWGRKNDIIDIDEYIKKGWFVDILYKECLDSKYCQAKIAEFMVNSFTNSELIEAGKINEIEEIITNNVYFNESKKNQLKRLLGKRIIEAIEENILKKTESDTSSMQSENAVERLTIEELDLSIRSFNCLNRAGIITVQDLMENTDEEIRNIRNFGKKSYDEVIDKLQSIGIEIIDGNFKFAGAELSESNKEQTDNTNENIIIRIEHEINNSNIFSEEEKEMLRKQLMERCYMEEESFRAEIVGDGKNSLEIIEKWPIEELDLSIRSYNCLARAGIKTVEDLMKKTDEEIRNIRNFGKKSYDEIIEKMQSVGIEIVDGHFIDAKSHNRSHIKRMSELEERINNNKYIREEKREELKKLLYETFDLTRADNQEIQSKLGDVESKEDLEEISKEELVKHILEQQRTIAKQREEIDELSSQKKEEINE